MANSNCDLDTRSQVITNLGLSFIEACKLNGARVQMIDLFEEREFEVFNRKPNQTKILEYQAKVKDADLLVFFQDMIWQYMPGLLKSFLDLVFVRGFAYKIEKKIIKGQLNGKQALVFVTSDLAAWQIKHLYGNILEKNWKKGFFDFCGLKGEVYLFSNLRNVSDKTIEKWQQQVQKIAKKFTKNTWLVDEILKLEHLD